MLNRSNAFFSIWIIALCFGLAIAQSSKNESKPKVLVLGTFHFNNPGRDVANVKVDDVFSEKRQKEIAEIIELLKKFKPTKIAIESNFGTTKANEQFTQYLAGTYQLTRNEIDQLGYRLAKESGHKQIYPIDWQGKFDLDKVIAFANQNGQKAEMDKLFAYIRELEKKDTENLQTMTFRQILKATNSPETLRRDHSFYLKIAKIGKDANYAGADLLRDWFERNLKIFTNISRIAENSNDRILVLIGGGHVPLLREFLKDSDEFEVMEVGSFL